MSRPRSNCNVTCELPVELDELISSMPAMVVNCRSSGLATEDAIVPGSPPGNPALTFNVGKSTLRKVADRERSIRKHAEDRDTEHD